MEPELFVFAAELKASRGYALLQQFIVDISEHVEDHLASVKGIAHVPARSAAADVALMQ